MNYHPRAFLNANYCRMGNVKTGKTTCTYKDIVEGSEYDINFNIQHSMSGGSKVKKEKDEDEEYDEFDDYLIGVITKMP